MPKREPKHAVCPHPGCKLKVPFSVWVYAHWNEALIATCPKGHRFNVCRGMVLGEVK